MTWIKTEPITVPAHANTTTVSEAGTRTRVTVSINEWFIENRSFLLGTPVANQLRGGDNGGWAQTCAVEAQGGQDTIALLRDRLQTMLKRAKVDIKQCRVTTKFRKRVKGNWEFYNEEVDAIAYNNALAVHETQEEPTKYTITQISSGLNFGSSFFFPNEESAKQCVFALLELPINWADMKEIPEEHKAEIIRLLTTYSQQEGDATTPPLPEDTETIQTQGDCNIMATVIPADKFESNSPYAFILRENPKASGIEIHFPPDATPDPGFIGRIASAGFQQAHSNPSLWYHKQYSDDLMAKARGWVKTCQRFGAYEISSSEPVEQTKSRRRGKPNGNKASSPAPESAPATGNKLVDAVCDRVQQMLDSLKEELVVKPDTSELDALRAENEQLKAQIETLTSERDAAEKVVASQRETITVAVAEVERLAGEIEERDRTIADIRQQLAGAISAGKEMVDCRDRTIAQLRQQLREWGVEEESAPVFDDEPVADAPDFDEEVPVFEDEPITDAPDFDEEVQDLGESASGSESSSEPDDIEESEASEPEGFDLDSLGE